MHLSRVGDLDGGSVFELDAEALDGKRVRRRKPIVESHNPRDAGEFKQQGTQLSDAKRRALVAMTRIHGS